MNVRSAALLMMQPSAIVSTSFVRCRFYDRARPPDHVVKVGPGRHHRVDAVFLLDAKIDDDRLLRSARRGDHALDLVASGGAQADEAMGFSELHEVRTAHGRRRIAASIEELLPLPHHPEKAVVDDGDVDLDALLRTGRE